MKKEVFEGLENLLNGTVEWIFGQMLSLAEKEKVLEFWDALYMLERVLDVKKKLKDLKGDPYKCKICGKILPNLPSARVHVCLGHNISKATCEKYIEEI